MKWAVVVFPDEGAVEVIPSSWISKLGDGKKICVWPPFSGFKFHRAVRGCLQPDESWSQCNVKVVAVSNDYKQAEHLCNEKRDGTTTEEISMASGEDSSLIDEEPTATLGKGCRKKKSTARSSEQYSSDDEPVIKSIKLPPVPKCLTTSLTKTTARSEVEEGATVQKEPSTAGQGRLITISPPRSQHISTYPPSPQQDHIVLQLFQAVRELRQDFTKYIEENKRFQEDMVADMKTVARRAKNGNEYLRVLLSHQNEKPDPDTLPDETLEILRLFPITNEEDMQTMEEKLQNQDLVQHLIKEFARRGGHSLKDSVTNILKDMFSMEVASAYSLDGRKGKKKFRNLAVLSVIIGAVRYRYKEATDSEIRDHIGPWLASAPFKKAKK